MFSSLLLLSHTLFQTFYVFQSSSDIYSSSQALENFEVNTLIYESKITMPQNSQTNALIL